MPTVAMNEGESTMTKKRTSLSHFLQGIPPTLKRKRSCCSSDTTIEQVIEPPKKKKMINRVTELIQKMAVTISSSVQPHRNHQKKKYSVKRPSPDNNALSLFQDHFSLPTIEWTNGSLGIILSEEAGVIREEEEEKEDDESIYLEFPTPPPKLFEQYNNIIRRNKKRQDSCPPRFHSLIESCHSDSSMLPLTPTTTTSSSSSSSSSTIIETETQFILKME